MKFQLTLPAYQISREALEKLFELYVHYNNDSTDPGIPLLDHVASLKLEYEILSQEPTEQ